jgi:glycosyltransferase involved in cell wall biosynthesis
MKRIKVVHLTTAHPALDVRIFHKECRTLQRAGYDVVVIGPHAQDETVTGVSVRAIAPPTSRWKRFARTMMQAYAAAAAEKPDLCHFHDPELIPCGWLLHRRGIRVVYDVHEDLPRQTMTKDWIPVWMRPGAGLFAAMLEAVAGRALDGIVAATPAIARRFPRHKTATVHNYPLWPISNREDPTPMSARPHRVVYAGAISRQRGIHQMLDAISRIPANIGAELTLAGEFKPGSLYASMPNEPGWRRTRYEGVCTHARVWRLLLDSRIGIVTLLPTPNHLDAKPVKLFEYMAAGLPVVASNFPLWKRIVRNARCGLVVDPRDPQAIADAIVWLFEHADEAEAMGKRGQRAVEQQFNWSREEPILLSLYGRLAGWPQNARIGLGECPPPRVSYAAHKTDDIAAVPRGAS